MQPIFSITANLYGVSVCVSQLPAVWNHSPSRATVYHLWAGDDGLRWERGVQAQPVPEKHLSVSSPAPNSAACVRARWQPAAHGLTLCCRKSKGLSGRALRKLPFLAHALFVKVKRLLVVSHCEHKQSWLFCVFFFLMTVFLFHWSADANSATCSVSGGFGPSSGQTEGGKIQPGRWCLIWIQLS